MTIYVAGPYTGSTEGEVWEHVTSAIDAGIAIYTRGHYPYVPHLTHFVEERSRQVGAGLRWEDYLHWDHAWLGHCDALLYLGSSRGADLELSWAEELGLEIFRSIDEIPQSSRPHAADDPILTQGPDSAPRKLQRKHKRRDLPVTGDGEVCLP